MTEPVIDQLAAEWAAIDELCRGLDDAEWDLATDCPGWTVRDQISHIIGTERVLAGESGPPAPATAGPHVRNPIGEANEAWVAERRGRPGSEVLAELR